LILFFTAIRGSAMESLSKQLNAIKKKFPEQSERIDELYETDEDFRTLCSDYLLCLQHLEKFQKDVGEKKHSLKEYREIQSELERELSQFIFDV
jgi:DNA repair exonuclease SbcCD ATPase subunit